MNNLQKRQVYIYFSSFFAFGLVMAAAGMALPFLAEHVGVSVAQVSIIFTMSSSGFFIGSLSAGFFYDRYRGNTLLAAGLTGTATIAFFIPSVSNMILLCALFFLYGMTNSTIVVGCNSLITRIHRLKNDGLMSGMHLVNGLGALLTPLFFSRVFISTGDIVLGYRSYSFFFVITAIIVISTPSPAITKKFTEDSKQCSRDSEKPKTRGINRTRGLSLLIIMVMFFFYEGAEMSFNGWIFTYIRTIFPGMDGRAGLVTATFWGTMTLGRFCAIILTRRISHQMLLSINLSGVVTGLAIIFFGSSSLLVTWVGTVLTGFSMGANFPLMLAYSEKAIGLSGKMVGVVFAVIAVSGMIFPYTCGQLFTAFSPLAIMICFFCAVSLALIMLSFLRIIRRKIMPQAEHVS